MEDLIFETPFAILPLLFIISAIILFMKGKWRSVVYNFTGTVVYTLFMMVQISGRSGWDQIVPLLIGIFVASIHAITLLIYALVAKSAMPETSNVQVAQPANAPTLIDPFLDIQSHQPVVAQARIPFEARGEDPFPED